MNRGGSRGDIDDVTMGIDNDNNGNQGDVSMRTMLLPPREHTIEDNDGNGRGTYR